jgi:hypothetical protein
MNTDDIISQLTKHFQEIVPLQDNEIDLVIQKLEFIQLKKKDYLLREGQVSRHMRFIAQEASMLIILMKKERKILLNSALKTGG